LYNVIDISTGGQDMSASRLIRLSKEQKDEGYWVERNGDYVLVWHNKNQIALLHSSPDINRKVKDVVERRRKELQEVQAKTGWKP
jgi:phosphosulfolactate synthase (CoM biosynthesis protein A)